MNEPGVLEVYIAVPNDELPKELICEIISDVNSQRQL
jgi:hypothetical protein